MLKKETRDAVSKRKARGSVALRMGYVVTEKEREIRRQQAQNTPYLDKLFSYSPAK